MQKVKGKASGQTQSNNIFSILFIYLKSVEFVFLAEFKAKLNENKNTIVKESSKTEHYLYQSLFKQLFYSLSGKFQKD